MDEKQQLSLFESNFEVEEEMEQVDPVRPFDVGDVVHVVVRCKENDDPESYYYLQGFSGKAGIIQKIIEKPSLQYEVLYGAAIACVYHHELEYGKPVSSKRG